MTQQQKIIAGIIGIVVLVGLIVVLRRGEMQTPSDLTNATSTAPTTTVKVSSKVTARVTPPSLDRDIAFSSNVNAAQKSQITAKIAELKQTVKTNESNVAAWYNLAIQYKTAGDYEMARKIWEYLRAQYADDGVSRHNLGDLYHFYLKDFPKSEMYYKEAISVDPTLALNYFGLYDLYRYSYKTDTSAAVDILMQALKSVSGTQIIDVYSKLGQHYELLGDKQNAIIYYTKARDAAQKDGNTELVASFNSLIEKLRK